MTPCIGRPNRDVICAAGWRLQFGDQVRVVGGALDGTKQTFRNLPYIAGPFGEVYAGLQTAAGEFIYKLQRPKTKC